MNNEHKPYGIYERFFKRLIDVLCALATLIVFWWLYVVVAILVKLKLGSPILFAQERPGKNEKIFKLYKFRSMTDEKDEKGKLLSDSARLTRFGKVLRATSLDELPEVFNILRGDMSVIGPRPLLVSYLPHYTDEERCRHDVRPGLTGLAQVNGRNYIDWDRRFQLDIQYVNKVTFIGDLKILFMTIKKFLLRSDVAEDTSRIEGNMAHIRSKEKEEN